MAANELNHSRASTTNQHYLKIEIRGLLNNEEEELFNEDMNEATFGHYLSKKISDNKVNQKKGQKI